MKNGKRISRWIDINKLPMKNNRIMWSKVENLIIDVMYDDVYYKICIEKFIPEKQSVRVLWNNKSLDMFTSDIKKCTFGRLFGTYSSEFKFDIGECIFTHKRDLIIIDRKYEKDNRNQMRKMYKYKCNKCGFDSGEHYRNGELVKEYWVDESSLRSGIGCTICCSCSKVVVPHINSIVAKEETMWMVDYFQGGYEEAKKYTPQSNIRLRFKCKDCSKIKDKKMAINTLHRTKSIGCMCGDGYSYPSKFMSNVLNQLKIEYIPEYAPNYLKKRENSKMSQKFSDFYIPSKNLIIEVDGGMGHKGGIIHNNSSKTIFELINVDNWKDEQHKLHGLNTIRIDCFESDMEYLKESILNSELVNYFDFSKVDWIESGSFALKNIVKEVCEYWNNKYRWETCEDLGNIFKVSSNTIRRYLRKGSEIGWCEPRYNPNYTFKKGKMIEAFKCGISLGIFPSLMDIERQSKELFGVKLIQKSITKVCRGEKPHYKGFTFKYVETSTDVDTESNSTDQAS